MSELGEKRVTFKIIKPNGNIEEILRKLLKEIAGKDQCASYKIEQAMESLSKYPLPLSSGTECVILKGFNKKLCRYINTQLEGMKWRKELVGKQSGKKDEIEIMQDVPVEINECPIDSIPKTTIPQPKRRKVAQKETFKNVHNTNGRSEDCIDVQLSAANEVTKEVVDMPAGSYDVVMLIDKNEPAQMFGSKGNTNKNCEPRSLKVGDVAWVARSKLNGQELVLPFVVERKRMDDFGASIKDGRFHEQKFRLRKIGLSNVIYLLEDHQNNKRCGLPMTTLNQAAANTRVQEGFMVHHTTSLKCTRKHLGMITMTLARELKNVPLRGSNTNSNGKELMTFEYFNSTAAKSKPLTIRELFIKMLLQLRGLSVEKALAITSVYNSPAALMNEYDSHSENDGELLLANLKFNNFSQKVGPVISKTLYKLFTRMKL